MSKNLGQVLFADSIAYLPGAKAAVYMGAGDIPAVRPSDPKITSFDSTTGYAPWGDDNLFPQNIVQAASRSTELPALLDWKSRAAQGKEVLPFTRKYDPVKNKIVDTYVDDPEIFRFLTSIQTKRYFREAFNDFFWFWNVFPDVIKSSGLDNLAYLGVHEATDCRWGKQNDKGVIEQCWVSPNWGNGTVTKENADIHPVIDPYSYSNIEKLKADNNIKRFVYPISYPSPGKKYYQLAPWDGFRTSGWMAIAEKVPMFKDAKMKNGMHIQYLIKIPTTYWATVYENWDDKTEDQKNACKLETLNKINAKLTNVDNAGKSILNEVGYAADGTILPGWDIEIIGDGSKEGAYIEDSQEASAHLRVALGLDSTLVGSGPSKGMGAGSGSDKRVAFNMYCALQNPYRDVVLEPLHFIAQYNGWKDKYPTLTFKTVEVELETLDKAHSTSQEKAA
jgi:hypothetical protein